MPRGPRNLYEGAICHVVQRGNNRCILFRDDEDYLKFLSIVKRYKEKYPFEVFNYCLMPNHIHVLIRILTSQISRAFQGIFQVYQSYYRKKYDYVGALYQNRFKSILVEDDSYLLDCARYIERNPLRAELVTDLDKYPWSSYHYYVKGKKDPLITPNPMYLEMGKTSVRRRKIYKEYLLKSRPYEALLDGIL